MEEKFKAGLANQAFTEFENVKNLREEFIGSGANADLVNELESVMDTLYSMYLTLTRK